ncbi:MAG: CcmD family protein [Acidobacteria bacterium]|nr:CcmD family protein [Acidobacteriota bacterium]
MNPINYLFSAYLAIWIILAVYLLSIRMREKKLQQEVEQLRGLIERADIHEGQEGKPIR